MAIQYDGRTRGSNRRPMPPTQLTATRTIRVGPERYLLDRRQWRIVATWQGGAYIDLHFDTAASPAFEVINVYDYAARAARIPFRQSALADRLAEWLSDNRDNLRHDLPNYAESVGYR